MRYAIPAVLLACGLAALGGWHAAKRHAAQSAPSLPVQRQAAAASTRSPAAASRLVPMLAETEEAARQQTERSTEQSEAKRLVDSGRRLLQQRFESEQADAAWARRKEIELESLVITPQMEPINAIPTSFNVECRSATCRIIADFANRAAAEDWLTLYLTTNGGLLKQASFDQSPQPDGTIRLQVVGAAR